ncbi:MAG: hypothetical protein DA329_06180 [Candidatus Nitrosocosmicus sp.]|nr:hypothetical protein [Candidatus Nitrosocosmicus sp.]
MAQDIHGSIGKDYPNVCGIYDIANDQMETLGYKHLARYQFFYFIKIIKNILTKANRYFCNR